GVYCSGLKLVTERCAELGVGPSVRQKNPTSHGSRNRYPARRVSMRWRRRRARAGGASRNVEPETAAFIYQAIVCPSVARIARISTQYPLALFDELLRGNGGRCLAASHFLVLAIEKLLDFAGSGRRRRRQRRYLVAAERDVVDHRAADLIEVRGKQLAD